LYEWYDDDGQQGEGEGEDEGEPGTKRRRKKKKAGTEFSAFNAAGRTTMLQLLRQREKVPAVRLMTPVNLSQTFVSLTTPQQRELHSLLAPRSGPREAGQQTTIQHFWLTHL
jgi:hypothetical protein